MNDGKDMSDSDIRELLGRLPREMAQQEDLWPAIETAITGESSGSEAMVAGLPKDIPPPDDLWSGIASELQRDDGAGSATARRHIWQTLAASVAFVAIVGFSLLRLGTLSGTVTDTAPDRVASESVDDWLSQSAFESEFVGSLAMTAAFEDARRTYLQEIVEVRSQREIIEDSLARYSDNPALRELWLHAYETELLLIDEAGRVLTSIQTG